MRAPPIWRKPVGLGAKRTRTMRARYLGYRPRRTMAASKVRSFWLFVGATLVVLVPATTATGKARGAGTPAAAPFAASSVPTTTALRKAKRIVVFGQEQDVAGVVRGAFGSRLRARRFVGSRQSPRQKAAGENSSRHKSAAEQFHVHFLRNRTEQRKGYRGSSKDDYNQSPAK